MTESIQVVMVTGPRNLPDVAAVTEALTYVFTKLSNTTPQLVVLSGGALGADTAAVHAAQNAGLPYVVEFPHKNYPTHYNLGEHAQALVENAVEVRYTVTGGPFHWRHNHARNDSMLTHANHHVVVYPHHPDTVTDTTKGGTAACIRSMRRLLPPGHPYIWINADAVRTPTTASGFAAYALSLPDN